MKEQELKEQMQAEMKAAQGVVEIPEGGDGYEEVPGEAHAGFVYHVYCPGSPCWVCVPCILPGLHKFCPSVCREEAATR